MRIPTVAQVETYLGQFLSERGKKQRVKVRYFGPLDEYQAKPQKSKSIKTLGYGVPLLVVYEVGGKRKESIISTMRTGRGFGHDFRADRIENLVLAFDTWNNLPRHCRVQDLGAFNRDDSSMISLGKAGEFFILRQKIEGTEYYKDLDRILSTGKLKDYDVPRARALAEYLSSIHAKKNESKEDAELYTRKIRDTVGHGECIFGLADSYPSGPLDFLKEDELESIEKKCIEHRWRLKRNVSRLSRVHGDYHPWNVLFSNDIKRKPIDFLMLDRSRGEWGEPADDVCAMSINYIFYSLRKHGRLEGEFEILYRTFIDTYLKQSRDEAILDAMPLFYVFRAFVIASPLWYPTLSSETRRTIFNFANNVLDEKRFDPAKVNEYLVEATTSAM